LELFASRAIVLKSLLYGVEPTDSYTLLAVAVVDAVGGGCLFDPGGGMRRASSPLVRHCVTIVLYWILCGKAGLSVEGGSARKIGWTSS